MSAPEIRSRGNDTFILLTIFGLVIWVELSCSPAGLLTVSQLRWDDWASLPRGPVPVSRPAQAEVYKLVRDLVLVLASPLPVLLLLPSSRCKVTGNRVRLPIEVTTGNL